MIHISLKQTKRQREQIAGEQCPGARKCDFSEVSLLCHACPPPPPAAVPTIAVEARIFQAACFDGTLALCIHPGGLHEGDYLNGESDGADV